MVLLLLSMLLRILFLLFNILFINQPVKERYFKEVTIECTWMFNTGQFTIKMYIWGNKILAFNEGWL